MYLVLVTFVYAVLVVKHCGQLCGQRRDRRLVAERELAQFIRGIMEFIYTMTRIPADYEVAILLKPFECECADIDVNLYRLHFGQFFRFDVSSQLPFFYKSVQKLLVALCRNLSSMWQRVWPNYLSFTPFDPTLIHSGSDDRRVDALVETCAVLTSHGLLDMGSGGTVQQQYLDVIQYFKRKWTALQDDVPVVEYVISMWMSYPHWERCSELKEVLDLVITITITGNYEVDFKDEASTALHADTLLSSLHLVRSWFAHSFVGKTRKNLRGLLRVAETTDMLVSRLSDAVRGKPWDQLLKVGLDQTLTRCMSVLTNDLGSAVTPMVDDYRSAVLAQLNVMEVVATSPIRPSTSPKAKRFIGPTKGKGARTQANVQIPIGSKEVSTSGKSIKKGGRQSDAKIERPGPSTRGHRGRRTGGKPRGAKTLVLSGCTSSPILRSQKTPAAKRKAKWTIVESSDES